MHLLRAVMVIIVFLQSLSVFAGKSPCARGFEELLLKGENSAHVAYSYKIDGVSKTIRFDRTNRGFMTVASRYPPEYTADEFLKSRNVLDVATGEGAFVIDLLGRGVNATGLDIKVSKWQRDVKKVEKLARDWSNDPGFHRGESPLPKNPNEPIFVQRSFTNTGFPDEHFGVVFASTVFHYNLDPKIIEAGLRELVRVTKKNGVIMISPFDEKNQFILDRLKESIPGISVRIRNIGNETHKPGELMSVTIEK